jgi:hypothetical protein
MTAAKVFAVTNIYNMHSYFVVSACKIRAVSWVNRKAWHMHGTSTLVISVIPACSLMQKYMKRRYTSCQDSGTYFPATVMRLG